MIIKKLVWDEWNRDHIAKHNGRYLTIILSPRAGGYFYPMTARDADNKERKRFKNEKD